MSTIRPIEKHYPMHSSRIFGSIQSQFAVKCQCEDWLEIHNPQALCDIVSLPSSMRMAQLYFCLDGSVSQTGETEYYFKRENNIWRGMVSGDGMSIEGQRMEIDNSILMSNAVALEGGQICNFSIDKLNKSKINVVSTNVEGQMSCKQLQIDWSIASYSNTTKGQEQTLLFVSDGVDQQNLMSFNLEIESMDLCLPLPDLEVPCCTQCFTLPRNSKGSSSNEPVCVWGRSWLGLADTRTSTLVSIQPLSYCQSAFAFGRSQSTIPKILYSEDCNLFEYDMRKGCSRRNPYLAHGQPITSCTMLGESVLGVEDVCSSTVHLYELA